MPETKVPKVDLLDINREPTDAELKALLEDMMVTVRAKKRAAGEAITPEVYDMILARAEKRAERLMGDTYMADMYAGIKDAAKKGAARAKEIRARSSPRQDDSEE